MCIVLCIILFVVFAVAQLLFTKKATNKVDKYIPMLTSAVGTVAAIGAHLCTDYLLYGNSIRKCAC